MKYVALLSGGKDSCYNLLHCHKNGHELVAAASLGPGPGKDELDSFMYQTVGQDAIEYVAKALDVPLYRKVISGAALEQGMEYGARRTRMLGAVHGDETEDLYDLLSTVKAQHPDVEGVCRRLNLTPLCYLWQRDQRELLAEMVEAGLEAVLIKVAGIGLKPEHLGRTLAQMQPTFLRLNDLYGSHICGEGGEYETLTLDCPLFKKRLNLIETETVIHSDSDFATVAFLRIKEASLEDKPINEDFDLAVPSVLQAKPQMIYEKLQEHDGGLVNGTPPSFGTLVERLVESSRGTTTTNENGAWISVSSVQANESGGSITVEEEVRQCFELLLGKLLPYSLEPSHCAHITILLSDMELFARVNAIYGRYFGISPPSRACVAVDLPAPTRIRLDCTFYREARPEERVALHVQGLSYWAPANIGPYSQAVIAGDHIFVSGQIGLIPSSLLLPSPSCLAMEFALCCQHVKRVLHALREHASWTGHPLSVIYWLANTHDIPAVKHGHELLCQNSSAPRVPSLFVVVKALPKGAQVEKQVLYHTGRFITTDEDGEVVSKLAEPKFEEDGSDMGAEDGAEWVSEVSYFQNDGVVAPFAMICVKGQVQATSWNATRMKSALAPFSSRSLSTRVFAVRETNAVQTLGLRCSGTYIPCRSVSTTKRDDWDAAICIMGT
ncbi:hypothetical protein PLEOSDRAFT_1112220 [Pleurotus ostreatus PC15]|uniref:Diphthine--ammonia ligase n=1 Tax=Pleurotus ostreatus (strain PC15) TaxID=1137138 RepID=A0A067NMQ2_PLEO1|nr:hypothetical protein PLEOSDRAFT_1112220 [Pleurotus ostreatus PC15]